MKYCIRALTKFTNNPTEKMIELTALTTLLDIVIVIGYTRTKNILDKYKGINFISIVSSRIQSTNEEVKTKAIVGCCKLIFYSIIRDESDAVNMLSSLILTMFKNPEKSQAKIVEVIPNYANL